MATCEARSRRKTVEVRSLYMVIGVIAVGMVFGSSAGLAQEPPELESLQWMVGCWRGIVDEVVMEEHWMAPANGLMPGLHRDTFPDGGVFFEYLRIVRTEDGVAYIASPQGRGETVFKLVDHVDSRVVFANLDHDFPKRITYWGGGDSLHAKIDGGESDPRSRQWTWRRVECR